MEGGRGGGEGGKRGGMGGGGRGVAFSGFFFLVRMGWGWGGGRSKGWNGCIEPLRPRGRAGFSFRE